MKEIERLLNKKVSRKEFLNTLLYGLMSIIGIVGVIDFLSRNTSNKNNNPVNGSYGSGAYGGNPKESKNKLLKS